MVVNALLQNFHGVKDKKKKRKKKKNLQCALDIFEIFTIGPSQLFLHQSEMLSFPVWIFATSVNRNVYMLGEAG